MLWYKGTVSEAIAESRRIGSLFIVYIKGDDEESKNMDAIWEHEQIKQVCLKDCTAIRLLADSNELKQFAAIYTDPVVYIPCTYFLDGVGTPLEVIAASLPAEQLLDKIKQTIQKHRVKFPKLEIASSPSTSAQSARSAPSSSSEPVQEKNDPEQSLAEKVERAKKLIEDKEKAEQTKKEAGHDNKRHNTRVQFDVNSEREETLAQQMAERIRVEKAKEKAARAAIRQKIAQDRAERAAKEEIEKREKSEVATRIDPRSDQNETNVQCSEVRLQFRFPDGSSLTQNFPPDALLDSAREFICSRMDCKKVTFWTTFPRKHLNEDCFTKSLSELGLAPSAALIVDPTSQSSSLASSSSSSLSSLLSLILAPLIAVVTFLKFLLFASPQQSRDAVQRDTDQATSGSASSFSTQTSDVRRRKKDDGNDERFKKDGKIHSFKQGEKDDDENNTWNGNSTQQM